MTETKDREKQKDRSHQPRIPSVRPPNPFGGMMKRAAEFYYSKFTKNKKNDDVAINKKKKKKAPVQSVNQGEIHEEVVDPAPTAPAPRAPSLMTRLKEKLDCCVIL
jgi:hypothetical protein